MKTMGTKHITRAACKLFAIALVSAACSADAALNSIDLVPGTGDGLITRDTVSGLEWLDHTQTLGLSLNNVFSGLGAGGQFQGFHLATLSEVNMLFVHAGLPEEQLFNTSIYAPCLGLITLLGGNVNSPTDAGIQGNINLTFSSTYYIKGVIAREQFGALGGITYISIGLSAGQSDPFYSSWLVRPVPEPSMGALLGLGSLMIVWNRARRRR